MDRSVPLWSVLLLLLLGLLGTVAFAAMAVVTYGGSEKFGALGRVAVTVARFPSEARNTLRDAWAQASGEDSDFLVVRQTQAVDLARYQPLPLAPGIAMTPPLFRAAGERLERGWRIIVGVFQFPDGHSNAALLLSPDLAVTKVWKLTPQGQAGDFPTPVGRRLVHEADLTEDGSFIYVVTPSVGLIKRDSCDELSWVTPGDYHHSVMIDETGKTVWVTRDREVTVIEQVDVSSGKVLRAIPFPDIAKANPETDIFRIRTKFGAETFGTQENRITPYTWLHDPFHTNDVDPLPTRLAAAFPQFTAGDLLVSNRELNLIFIMDPDTLKVKWWNFGNFDRQHDPDWLEDGRISVFDNRMRHGDSRIVTIDPRTNELAVAADGRKMGFFSIARGKSLPLPGGGYQIASAFQGRIFETDADGAVVLDIVNTRENSPDLMFMTTQTFFFPEGQLDWSKWKCKPRI